MNNSVSMEELELPPAIAKVVSSVQEPKKQMEGVTLDRYPRNNLPPVPAVPKTPTNSGTKRKFMAYIQMDDDELMLNGKDSNKLMPLILTFLQDKPRNKYAV